MKDTTLIRNIRQFENTKSIPHAQQQFEEIVATRLKFMPIPTNSMAVYRAVPWNTPPDQVAKLSYPPENITKRGRCNEDRKPVFYCSLNYPTVYAEQKNLKKGMCFAVGKWIMKKPAQIIFIGLTERELDEFNRSCGRKVDFKFNDDFNRMIHKKIRRYFSQKGDKYYSQSIAISQYLQSLEFPIEKWAKESILGFISVEHPNKVSLPINFSIPISFVDENMELVQCQYEMVSSVNDHGIEVDIQYFGDIQEDNRIKWRKPNNWPLEPGKCAFAKVVKGKDDQLIWQVENEKGEILDPSPISSKVDYF